MTIRFELLNDTAAIQDFDCGEEPLNDFLVNLALLFQKRHFGATIVCYQENALVGYYTLCPASIQRDALSEKTFTGPRPNPIPGFRLCRLAIDKRFQGQGYGKILFVHALKKCLDQALQIGGSVVIIDAKNEKAKQFYERYGFISLPHAPLTLVQTIKFIQKHFQ